MSDRVQARIDINALHHNLERVRAFAPGSKVLAMVKGNAYGHGLVSIGKILSQVDGLGVACLEEAIKLREGGVNTAIVLMSGVYSHSDLQLVDLYGLQIVVHDPFQLQLLQSAQLSRPVAVWLKIDTGMHRLGFPPDAFNNAYKTLTSCSNIAKPINILTHLADADDLEKDSTLHQMDVFNHYTTAISCPKSIANSAGIISWPQTVAQWNRPGIMLYGLSPMRNKIGDDHGLKAVMTLRSKIIALHDLHKGDAVGYGGTWICPEDMRVGVVAIGYGDGYPRHAKSGCPTLVKGKICPLVGRVSMDLISIDLRNCPQAVIGDIVLLWGNGLPAEIVARYSDTIAYELLCNVARRVRFAYE